MVAAPFDVYSSVKVFEVIHDLIIALSCVENVRGYVSSVECNATCAHCNPQADNGSHVCELVISHTQLGQTSMCVRYHSSCIIEQAFA